jgi:hypothetical protein
MKYRPYGDETPKGLKITHSHIIFITGFNYNSHLIDKKIHLSMTMGRGLIAWATKR